MMRETEESIQSAFEDNNLDMDTAALTSCLDMCLEFNLSSNDLVSQWDIFSMNSNIQKGTSCHMKAFRSSLSSSYAKSNNNSTSSKENKRRFENTPKTSGKLVKNHKTSTGSTNKPTTLQSILKTPTIKRPMTFASPGESSRATPSSLFSPNTTGNNADAGSNEAYENRKNAGKIESTFNPELQNSSSTSSDKPIISFTIPYPAVNTPSNFSYMYTPLAERSAALEAQLVSAEELFTKHHQTNVELGCIGDPSPATVTVVGRIACDASSEGKLNSGVITLEGSRASCGGARVLLDVSAVSEPFTLFPGKIVALAGIFDTLGRPMLVKRFLSPEFLKAPLSTITNNKKSSAVNVMVASGPYTPSSNGQFTPLTDLVQVVKSGKCTPDVLVLIGPFIDANHSSFKDGLAAYEDGINLSYGDLFLFRIVSQVDKLLDDLPNLHVVLIPSLRDAHHDFVYPTPPFAEQEKIYEICAEHKSRLHLLSNPATFAINDVVFGVSAIDVLLQLGTTEVCFKGKDPQNNAKTLPRLERLATQLVETRSFYPIFPPPATGDAPIDVRFIPQFGFEVTPDVLILPSVLNKCVFGIDETVVINPGALTRGNSGGTFASMTIYPNDSTNDDDGKMEVEEDSQKKAVVLPHNVASRTTVEIKRI